MKKQILAYFLTASTLMGTFSPCAFASSDAEIMEQIPQRTVSDDVPAAAQSEEEEDFEVELDWLWDSNAIYETAAKDVPCWSKKGSNKTYKNSKIKRKIAKAGTIVKVVDTEINDSLKQWAKTDKGDWIFSDNLTKHTHSGPKPASSTTYKSATNKYHYPIVKTEKQICTKCKNAGYTSVIKKANTDKQVLNWKEHDWNSTGSCKSKGCGHTFEYSEKSASGTYILLKDVSPRSKPYSASSAKGNDIKKGKLVEVKKKTENCFGNLWYKTSDGGWIYSENIEKHSHSYSDYSGSCSCDQIYNYSKRNVNMDSETDYELKSYTQIRKHPYVGAASIREVYAGEVIKINGYTNSYPGWNPFADDKWFRVKGGGWVHHSFVKLHTKHNCEAGICQNKGCSYEYPIETRYFTNNQLYETTKVDVPRREVPYGDTWYYRYYDEKGTVFPVKGYAYNEPGNKWYLTADNKWVWSENAKPHIVHTIAVDECVNPGCDYIINVKTKTFSNTKYVTTKDSVPARTKPFDDAPTSYSVNGKGSLVTINAKTTNLEEIWYRTSDSKWIRGSHLKEHKHSIKDGVCTVCGADAPYTVTNLVPTIVETTKNDVPIWNKPYSNTYQKRTVFEKGTKMIIIAKAENYYKNIWYKLSDGSWVYKGNVEPAKGSEVKNSVIAKISTYILTVTDPSNNPLAGARVNFLDTSFITDEKGNAEMIYVPGAGEITVTLDNYNEYKNSSYVMDSSRRGSITISEKGSYKAVNVNVKHNGEVTDVLKKSKNLNQAVTNMHDFTVTCVMGDSSIIGKYELKQGKKSYVSSDGKFTGLNAKSFDPDKTISLITYNKNDQKKSTQNLLINIVNKGNDRDMHEVGFAGDGIEFKFGNGAPGFLNGMSLTIPLPKILPISFNVSDEKIQFALNMVTSEDKDKHDKFWKDLKDLKGSSFKNFYEKNKNVDLNKGKKKNPLIPDVSVGGYLEYALDGSTTLTGKVFVNLEWGTSKEFQIYPGPPVPFCGEWSVKAVITPSGKIVIKEWSQISGSLDWAASLTLGIAGGVGYADVGSLLVYGEGTLKGDGEILPKPSLDTLAANASFGAKVKVLGQELVKIEIWNTKDLMFVEDGVWVLSYDEQTQSYDELKFTKMDRSYLENRGDWYESSEEEVSLMSEAEEGAPAIDEAPGVEISDYDYSILQNSTYTDIRPQIVTSDNTIMMLYPDDAAERTDADRTMLVYSVYDTQADEWSAPKPVCDDNTADFGFKAVSAGENIYVVWQNAKSALSDGMTIEEIGKQTELSVASYDAAMDTFTFVETITDNDKMEVMPHIAAIEGKLLITWVNNSQDDPFAANGTNTIHYAYKNEREYSPEFDYVVDDSVISTFEGDTSEREAVEEEVAADFVPVDDTSDERVNSEWQFVDIEGEQPWITSMAAGYLDDIGCIAFTTDMDGDAMTYEDQKVNVIDTSTNEVIPYTDCAMNVEFTQVHGDNAMTWYNQGYIYYALDTESAPQMLYADAAIPADEYHIISDDIGNMAILYAPKNGDSSNAAVILYDDETFEWGMPVQVTKQEDYIQNFNGAYFDGMIVSVFNNTRVDNTTWTEVNDLCTAIIGERHDIRVTNVSLSDINILPNEEKEMIIDVTNNGTVRTSKLQLTVFDGDEIVSEKTIDKIIRSGASDTIETTITMPDKIEKNTYRIAVEEVGINDDVIADNYYEYTIGKSSLNISAVASPTETENIVVITVENKGYEPSSGSIVLYDEQGNITTTLLENFDDIEHGESIDCAFLVGDEYFIDEASVMLAVGVIPNVEQDTNAYCQTSVIVKQLPGKLKSKIQVGEVNLDASIEASDDEVTLAGAEVQTISGSVVNDTQEDITDGVLYVTAYDSRGIYLDTYITDLSVEGQRKAAFTATFAAGLPINNVKIMLMKKGSIVPLVDTSTIEISDEFETESDEDFSDSYGVIITDERWY